MKLVLKNRAGFHLQFYVNFTNPPCWHRCEIHIRRGWISAKYAVLTPKNAILFVLGNILFYCILYLARARAYVTVMSVCLSVCLPPSR